MEQNLLERLQGTQIARSNNSNAVGGRKTSVELQKLPAAADFSRQ